MVSITLNVYLFSIFFQMNVYYSTVKEVSDGGLDLYVYPAAIVYPDVSTSMDETKH